MKYFIVLVNLLTILHSNFADVNSTTGTISFDVNSDGIKEMVLNSEGLGIKTSNGVSSLEVQGSFGMSVENLNQNTNLSSNSLVLADTSSSNLTLTLPYAGNVKGRFYTIKKTSALNKLYLSGGGNLIDDLNTIELNHKWGVFPSIDVMSDGFKWHVIRPGDYLSPIASDNLVGYWDMDEASGNLVLDQSGEGHDATATGFSETNLKTLGKIGRAVNFDGVDDLMNPVHPYSDQAYFHNQFTERSLSLWCTIASDNDVTSRLIWNEGGASNGVGLAYNPSSKVFEYATAISDVKMQINSITAFDKDELLWIHVGLVYDNGQMILYINGEKEATGMNGTSMPYHLESPGIGGLVSDTPISGSRSPWKGKIDEVRWYNKALSSDEMRALYNRGL